jgi:8-oxo-dGTP pyrophosphatase MutT (NUDIX family)
MEKLFFTIKKKIEESDRPVQPAGENYDSTSVFLLLFSNDEMINIDELVKSPNSDGKIKSSSSRRRESRVMRLTDRTPQSQRDEAQRRNRTFYEAVNILTVQKTDNEGYPWRNQVALPGGHVDKEDSSPLEAAYRELEEELKIKKEHIELMGSLGHFQTINHKDLNVFVGIWKTREPVSFDTAEISRVIEIPLKTLVKTHIDSNFQGRIPDVFELLYPFQDVTIWGVTARILHHFIEVVYPLLEGEA